MLVAKVRREAPRQLLGGQNAHAHSQQRYLAFSSREAVRRVQVDAPQAQGCGVSPLKMISRPCQKGERVAERLSPFLEGVCSCRTKTDKYATPLSMSLRRSLWTEEGKTLRRVKKVASGEWAQDLLAAWVTDGGRDFEPQNGLAAAAAAAASSSAAVVGRCWYDGAARSISWKRRPLVPSMME